MDYIKFAEDLEDICESFKAYQMKSFGENDDKIVITLSNYDFNKYNFIIGMNEDGFFTCDVVKDGFYIENPSIQKIYKDKLFSKEELTDFLKNFENLERTINNDTYIEPSTDFREILKNETIVIKGIVEYKYSSFDEYYEDLEKDIHDKNIVYLEDIENNRYYRMELYTYYGMCGSGYSSASWGTIEVNTIDELPKEYSYYPKQEFIFKESKISEYVPDEYYDEDEFSYSIVLMNGDSIRLCGCDRTGGDSYYPRGGSYIVKDETFMNNFIEGSFVTPSEEIIPLEEITFEDSEKDYYDDYVEEVNDKFLEKKDYSSIDITFIEDLKDICEDFDEVYFNEVEGDVKKVLINFSKNEYGSECNSFYSFEIEETYGLFTCKVIKDGFYIENPTLREVFKNEFFSKEELSIFMKEFPLIESSLLDSNKINLNEFNKMLEENSLTIRGINRTFCTSFYVDEMNESIEKILPIDIVYLEDEYNRLYRVELSTSCTFDETSLVENFQGNIDIQRVSSLPSNLNYITLNKLTLRQMDNYIDNLKVYEFEHNGESSEFMIHSLDKSEKFMDGGSRIILNQDYLETIFNINYKIREEKVSPIIDYDHYNQQNLNINLE